MRMSVQEIWFQVVAEGDGPPEEIRWRNLLKRMLRDYGLRCLAYGPVPPEKQKAGKRRKEINAGEGPAEQENR